MKMKSDKGLFENLRYDLKKLLWQPELNPRVRCAFGNVFFFRGQLTMRILSTRGWPGSEGGEIFFKYWLEEERIIFSSYIWMWASAVFLCMHRFWQISIILLFIYSDVYQDKPRCRTTGMSWSKYHGYDTISKYGLSNFLNQIHAFLAIMISFLLSNAFFTVKVYWLFGGELQWHQNPSYRSTEICFHDNNAKSLF